MPLVQTYPPLGQVTPLESGRVDVRAVLDNDVANATTDDAPWDVVLRHSTDSAAWAGTQLRLATDAESEPQCLNASRAGTRQYYYAASLQFSETVQFTLKYRRTPEAEWTWAHDEQGIADGTLVVKATRPLTDQLDSLVDLSPGWDVTECLSQTPRTQLWSLRGNVPSEDGHDGTPSHDICIGAPRAPFLRWFALVRNSSPWLAPRQGKEHLLLDKDAILCAFLARSGRYLVFLAVAGADNVVSVLQSTPEGQLSVHARCDSARIEGSKATVLVAESDDLGCAIAATMYHSRRLVSSADASAASSPESTQSSEPWYDGLGYCTWNSLGQSLTEDKILNALDDLVDSGISVSSLIVDDNWQSIDQHGDTQYDHGWLDFEADPRSFPRGLAATVSTIRERHPGIRDIAVWHALLGYWGGISPDGPLSARYKTVDVPRRDGSLPIGGTMRVVEGADEVQRLYDDFYGFLAAAGITSVKTDAQFMVDTWLARRDLAYTYLDAWAHSALRHFAMRATSCMSLFPQAIFRAQTIPGPTFALRSSDDFAPDEPSAHAWHVWANAHNCVLLQFLDIVPDWDMFQTAHDFAGFHAAARCVSGGPICITDVPGCHDRNIISQISGTTLDGRTTIFRPSVMGKAVNPFVGYHDNAFLKVGSYNGASQTGTPILGVFNVSGRPLTELVPLSEFPGTVSSIDYVVRAHTADRVSDPTDLASPRSLFNVTLGTRGFEVFSAYPLERMACEQLGVVSVANLGLVDKMTGCAAIVKNAIHKQDNGQIRITTRLKALGVLGIYISCLPCLVVERDFMITIFGTPVPLDSVAVVANNPCVLKVDVERAWKEMDLGARGKEVDVMAYFAAR